MLRWSKAMELESAGGRARPRLPVKAKGRVIEMKRILIVAMAVSLNAWAQGAKPPEAKPAEPKAEKAEPKAEKAEKKEATAAPAMPQPPKPSAETEKLAKLFGSKKAMTGKMAADAMGPGSPEMPTKSTADCRAIAEKFFYACDIDVTMGTGKQKGTWKAHFLT